MKFEDLKNSLKEMNDDNFYIIYGEDNFMKDSAINQIKDKVVDCMPELNYTVFSIDDLDENIFFQILETAPLLSNKKMVVLKIYDDIKSSFINKLVDYFKVKNEFTVLVISSNTLPTLPKTLKPILIDCTKISESVIRKYIMVTVSKANASIYTDAIDSLILYCNSNMSFIVNELNKCLSLTDCITKDIVENFVTKHTQYKIYEFADSIGRKNKEKSINILDSFLNDKDISPLLIYLLYNHFRQLYFLSLNKNNNNLSLIAKQFKIHEYAVTKLKEQLKFYTSKQLSEILKLISDSDFKIKSGELDLKTAIYNIVFSIICN